jgi:hypothetical protein
LRLFHQILPRLRKNRSERSLMAKKMVKPKITSSTVNSIDKELATHLKKAEEHLIAAVKLFARKSPPERHADFLKRLVRAQELVTWVRRDELVRARGLIRATKSVKK